MAIIIRDTRTPEQAAETQYLVVMTDRFLSGWGAADGGLSYAAWACRADNLAEVEREIRTRRDALRVRVVVDRPGKRYRPGPGCAHLTVYSRL